MHRPHLFRRILATALLGTACGTHASGLPDLKSFDRIITRDLLAAGYRDSVPLSFGVVDQDSTRVYWSEYQFARADPAEHYTCAVTVAKGGRRAAARRHLNQHQVNGQFPNDQGLGDAEVLLRETLQRYKWRELLALECRRQPLEGRAT